MTNQRDEREVAERLKQIRETDQEWRRNAPEIADVYAGLESDIDFLLSLHEAGYNDAAARMRERCVARVKEVPMPTHLSESGEEIVTHFRARVIRYLQSVTLEAAANSVKDSEDAPEA